MNFGSKIARVGGALSVSFAAVALSSCDRPPSADEINAAYRAHLARDATQSKLGGDGHLESDGVPTAATPIRCQRDGSGHFHCRVRFTVDFAGKRSTREHMLHLVPEEYGWSVESVEDP